MIFKKGDPIYTDEWQTVKVGHKLLSRSLKYLKKAYRDRSNSIIYDHFDTMPSRDYWDLLYYVSGSVGVSDSAIDVCMKSPYYGYIQLGKRCYAKPPLRTVLFLRGFKENMKPNVASGYLYLYWYDSITGSYAYTYIDLSSLSLSIYTPVTNLYTYLYPDYISFIDCIGEDIYTRIGHGIDTFIDIYVTFHNFEGITYRYLGYNAGSIGIPTYDRFWLYFRINRGWKAKFTIDAIVAYQLEPYDS